MVRNKVLVVLSLLWSSFVAEAQGVMFKSNEDFGITYTIYGDDQQYPQKILDQELLRIQYHCQLAFEDENRKPLEAEYILQVGRDFSKYYQAIQHKADSLLDNGPRLNARYQLYEKANSLFVQECYYVNRRTREITVTGRMITEDFSYVETLPVIDWRLTDSCRTVCGYVCRMATGLFRGREYEAWYAEEIPASVGPWKLQGLPGAILLVEETKHTCLFEAVEIISTRGNIRKNEYPYIEVSRKQYAKMQNQFLENHGLFASQHTSRVSGLRIQVVKKSMPLPRPVWLELE